MEYHWTLINNSTSNSNGVREHNNGSNHAWETWDLATSAAISREDWSYPLHNSFNYNYTPSRQLEASAFHTLMLQDQEKNDNTSCSSPYVGNLDPHLTCLKLGKRHYFEDVTTPLLAVAGPSTKKGKTYYAPPVTVDDSALTVVPRCQVEGCEAVLVSAKDYHRRHKVCEMHAKAPKVVLLGIEQRFCQQCSRFHAVAEFDESKRSCRRRLAGHNERRRKSSQEHQSLANKHSQDMKMMDACRQPEFLNSSECALSLLSSTNYSPWNRADLPSRCSAALRELIAENRASILACRQIQNYKLNGNPQQNGGGHVTLDLMQVPSSAFGFLSVNDHKSSSKETNEEDCSELWKLPLGYSSHSL